MKENHVDKRSLKTKRSPRYRLNYIVSVLFYERVKMKEKKVVLLFGPLSDESAIRLITSYSSKIWLVRVRWVGHRCL